MDVYRVELSGVQQFCKEVEDRKSKMTTGISTVEFTNLQVFSIYNVTITVVLPSGFSTPLTPTVEFTTKAAGTYIPTNHYALGVAIHAFYLFHASTRALLQFQALCMRAHVSAAGGKWLQNQRRLNFLVSLIPSGSRSTTMKSKKLQVIFMFSTARFVINLYHVNIWVRQM